MHADRLLKLSELLEADAANPKGIKFDLSIWGENLEGDCPDISCGTTACAMGLAVLSGAFAEYGLINGSMDRSVILPEIRGRRSTGFDAASDLFGINYSASEYLFSDSRYDDDITGSEGEIMVAARIRVFVAYNMPG